MSNRPQLSGAEPSNPTAEELCIYVADMCGELRALARHPRLRTLCYLLDMARLEAERMSRDLKAADGTPNVLRRQ